MAFGTPQVVVASGAQVSNGNSAALSTSDVGNAAQPARQRHGHLGHAQHGRDGRVVHGRHPLRPQRSLGRTSCAVHRGQRHGQDLRGQGPFFRVKWVITGGTPSLTFSVTAYVTP
jgi:hypothetical protein